MTSISTYFKNPRAMERVIYVLLILVFTIPYLYPLKLPLAIEDRTRVAYNMVEALQPGDIVVFSQDVGAGMWGETGAAVVVVMQHLFQKEGVKIVICEMDRDQTPQMTELALSQVDKHGKEYGVDWVHLGFSPGWEAAVAAFAQDTNEVYSTDFYGDSIAGMPLMQEARSHEDFDLVVTGEGCHTARYWLYQWADPFGIPVLSLIPTFYIPDYIAYYPHLMKGMVAGLRAGAEYEFLANQPGAGLQSMDAMSASQLLAVALLILGNVNYLYQEYGGGKKND